MFRQLLLVGFTLLTTALSAQESWSLERCVRYAQENSPSVKQSKIQVESSKLTNKENRFSQYPTLNGGSNLGFNFGRTVNPSTNQFENTNSNFNSYSLTSSVLVYGGGRVANQIKQSASDVKASEADLEQAAQQLALQVAQSFLQVLLNEEQLENAKKRLVQDQNQLERIDKQIKAGAVAANARYDILSQVARSEQQVVTAQNNVDLSYLTLKNFMFLAPDTPMKLEKPNVVIPNDANPDAFSFKMVYNQALGNQPQIRAGEYRIQGAQFGVKIAQAQTLPSLFAQGSLVSNYSNLLRDLTKPELLGTKESAQQPVRINGNPANISFIEPIVSFNKKAYGAQLADNFGQGFSLSLQVPIFNGFARQIGVQRAKLNVESRQMQLEQTKQQLRADVQNAIASARAARKQYEVAMKVYDAQKNAYEATDKRFQVGNSNSFELTQAKNALDIAERDLTVAKYDYLFKLKIVEFYEGKKLTLK